MDHLGKYAHLYLIFLYFSFPKIDLYNFSTFRTGIRANDLLVLILFILNFKLIKKFLCELSNFYLLLLASLITYNLFTRELFEVIFVSSRMFEYFVLGFSFFKTNNKEYLVYAILSFNIFIAILQKIYLLPVIDPIRGAYLSETMNGTFGTPAEFSYFIILILFILTRYMKSKYSKFLFPIALENSISAAFLSSIWLFKYDKFLKLSLLPIYYYCVIFTSTSLPNSITFAQNLYYSAFTSSTYQEEYRSLNTSSPRDNIKKIVSAGSLRSIESEKISLNYRTIKWKSIINDFINSKPLVWIFGAGMNAAGSLDGGLIKSFYEYGLLGFIFFLSLARRMSAFPIGIIISTNIAFDGITSSIACPLINMILLYEIYKKP